MGVLVSATILALCCNRRLQRCVQHLNQGLSLLDYIIIHRARFIVACANEKIIIIIIALTALALAAEPCGKVSLYVVKMVCSLASQILLDFFRRRVWARVVS